MMMMIVMIVVMIVMIVIVMMMGKYLHYNNSVKKKFNIPTIINNIINHII
jgi:hypothetical protein